MIVIMKNIRHSLYLFLALSFVLLSGCTKYDFVETGRANGNHNTTMWEYFKSDPYNWSLLVRLSSRIGLQDVFEGKSSYGKEITFLGITNHSIRRYLLKKYAEDHSEDELNRLKQEKQDALFDILADDLDANEAKAFILSSIIPKRAITLEEFKLGSFIEENGVQERTGGENYTMASGKVLWLYTFKDAYAGVPGAGRLHLYIVSSDTKKKSEIASHDIRTTTGIVHSLQYSFTLGDF